MNLLDTLRQYLHNVNHDWNYITPLDFYNNFYLQKKDYYLIDLKLNFNLRKGI